MSVCRMRLGLNAKISRSGSAKTDKWNAIKNPSGAGATTVVVKLW